MLKIGDFSSLSRVTVKALRYYDEIGLLKPVQVDRFTGYRYYSAEQLPRLNRIVVLKGLGLSLEEVTRLLDDDLPVSHLIQLLHVKQAEIRGRLEDDGRRLDEVERWLNQIKKEGTMPAYDVVIKKVAAQRVASMRNVVPTYSDIGLIFNEIFPYLTSQKAQWAGPPIAIYHDMEYRERDVDIEVAIPIAGALAGTGRIKVGELPAIAEAACLIYRGPYEMISEGYKTLMGWIESHGYQLNGPNREIYLEGPGQAQDPKGYVTEIQVPVTKK